MESDTGEGGREEERGKDGKRKKKTGGGRRQEGREREGEGRGEGGRQYNINHSLLPNGLTWTHVEVVIVYIHTLN